MSRRIKPDRRAVVDRGAAIEIINWIDYPGIPQDFVDRLKVIKKDLEYHIEKFRNEIYRDDEMRKELAWIMFIDEMDNLKWLMKEYRMIPDDDPPEFWGK